MATPLRPSKPAGVEPCSVCGSRVNIVVTEVERALGKTQTDTYTRRVCSNPECDTNWAERALGQTP